MQRLSLFVAVALCVPVSLASAAEIKCKGVDDSAVTHYNSGSTATATTKGKDCTVSIGGASASSAEPDLATLCLGRAINFRPFWDSEEMRFVAGVLVPYLVFTAVSDAPLPDDVFDPEPPTDIRPDSCVTWFDSAYHQWRDFLWRDRNALDLDSDVIDGIYSCFAHGDSGRSGPCAIDGNRIVVEFESSFGHHTVQLPIY